MPMITLKVDTAEELEVVAKGGEPLIALCRNEVDNFDRKLRAFGHEFSDGLAKFERLAIEGYLYQKLRGHLDEKKEPDVLPG